MQRRVPAARREGIEMLMREMVQERTGRARFHRKVQLTQLCISTGHDAIAFRFSRNSPPRSIAASWKTGNRPT